MDKFEQASDKAAFGCHETEAVAASELAFVMAFVMGEHFLLEN